MLVGIRMETILQLGVIMFDVRFDEVLSQLELYYKCTTKAEKEHTRKQSWKTATFFMILLVEIRDQIKIRSIFSDVLIHINFEHADLQIFIALQENFSPENCPDIFQALHLYISCVYTVPDSLITSSSFALKELTVRSKSLLW